MTQDKAITMLWDQWRSVPTKEEKNFEILSAVGNTAAEK
jgi:hypothetical protein